MNQAEGTKKRGTIRIKRRETSSSPFMAGEGKKSFLNHPAKYETVEPHAKLSPRWALKSKGEERGKAPSNLTTTREGD